MRLLTLFFLTVVFGSAIALGADKYTGPRPPKADVPYLVHADNLLETEHGTSGTEERKNETWAYVDGSASNAKTPLAEPILLIRTEKLNANKLEVYQMEVKNGRREVLVVAKRAKDSARPVHVTVTQVDSNLYRIEVDEPLENGEYVITPAGAPDVFAFSIY
jgi:hypothetical protein